MKKKNNKAWNKESEQIQMTLWNPWGMCNERMNYCRTINYDILGLPEMHNTHTYNKKFWHGKHWVTSEDATLDEQGKNTDSTSGVAILLSKRFADKKLAQGSIGSRIVWVRIDGPVCPLFVVCVNTIYTRRNNSN